ncbi:DUF3298 and DUF4163 domain-containing protein [Romboutsia sp.]|uniref:DUF3298 and DUF4163 domain-containing protein n=1 Tax=Romboutsia sp. TaxID=1965302 RepID=UPI003F4088B5
MENYSYIAEVKISKDSEFFKYNIVYPVIRLYKECVNYNSYSPKVIEKINYEIYKDVMDFKNSVKKESKEYKKIYKEQLENSGEDYVKYKYETYVDYEVPYDQNNLISIIITKYQFTGGAHGMTFLDNYNYNLLTGERLQLKDMFKDGVDYKSIVNDYINKEISKNPEDYFKDEGGFKGIIENQNFYLEDDGIVVYFSLYEIAPYYVGIPKFKLKYEDFKDYLK